MTKKDYIAFASVVRADLVECKARFPKDLDRTLIAAGYAASTFAAVAARDNSKFDYDRFMIACGVRGNL